MSQTELRTWCRRHVKKIACPGKPGEFSSVALARHLGIDRNNLRKFVIGSTDLSDRFQRSLSRFAQAWDAGMLEVVSGKYGFRELRRRETPRHMPAVMKIELAPGQHPKLTLIGRGAPPARMPRGIDIGKK